MCSVLVRHEYGICFIQENDIVVDTVLITGSSNNAVQKSLTFGSGIHDTIYTEILAVIKFGGLAPNKT